VAKRTITKRELCERIAKETGLTQVAVKASVQGFLDAIIEELSRGNRLEFRDFGVFDTRVQAARKARNPRTGEVVHVGPKAIAYFKVGKKMEEVVQRALPLIEQGEARTGARAGTTGTAMGSGDVSTGS
jgi:integration host factor subunit beta